VTNVLTEDAIREYLTTELGVDSAELDSETLLFSSGLVDSFALMSLMTYIESETGHVIPPADVKLENLDSISLIRAYLAAQTVSALV
jgi:acyl carrier protein